MEGIVKKIMFTVMLGMAGFLCAACVMTAGPRGTTVTVVPPLPLVVELVEPYYVHAGFFYYFTNNRWYYSQHKGGPWIDLPRDRYPKEVRHKGKDDRGHGRNRVKDWKR